MRLNVRSRNHSCARLRQLQVPVRTLYRMGSTTPVSQIYRPGTRFIEINTVKGCHTSGNKILMKQAFDRADITHAEWMQGTRDIAKVVNAINKWGVIIAKRKNSYGGNGIYLIRTIRDISRIPDNINDYVFEKFYNYSKEYRLHVMLNGDTAECFYTSRKMLRREADERWHRHHMNSVFFNEDNPQFDKPSTWDAIVKECGDALKACGLHIAAFDVKVANDGRFVILEVNSAPALGDQGIEKYSKAILKFINTNR